ncbi:MAG: transcription-repair coupling factor [Lachnospiraceae bacterium]|nr:transcription-repair coupling factor [Lachnospiraceae bacterium]
MKAFTAPMRELGEFEEISQRAAKNRGLLQVTGCIDSQKSHFVYCMASAAASMVPASASMIPVSASAVPAAASAVSVSAGRVSASVATSAGASSERASSAAGSHPARLVTLIITHNDLRAKEMFENYRFFDRDILYFPAKDLIFFQADIQSNLLEQQRTQVLKVLAEAYAGENTPSQKREEKSLRPLTIITTVAACMNRMVSSEDWVSHVLEIGLDGICCGMSESSGAGTSREAAELSLDVASDIVSNIASDTAAGVESAPAGKKAAGMDSIPERKIAAGVESVPAGKTAAEIDTDKLKKDLIQIGYERVGQVEGPGQFAIRGGIIDIFPLTEENPVRIELWGEEVDSIRSFDVESQRSIENLERVRIYPAAELMPDAAARKKALKRIEKEAKAAEERFRKLGTAGDFAHGKRLDGMNPDVISEKKTADTADETWRDSKTVNSVRKDSDQEETRYDGKTVNSVQRSSEPERSSFLQSNWQEPVNRIHHLLQDCRDELTEFGEPLSMEGFLDYFTEERISFLDYFDPDRTLIFLDEPNRIMEAAAAVELEFSESMKNRLEKGYVLSGQTKLLFSAQETAAAVCRRNAVGLCTLENVKAPWVVSGKYSLTVRSVNPYNNSFEYLVKDLKGWKKSGYRVILLAASRTRGNRLAQDLTEEGLSAFYTEKEEREVQPGEILITYGNAKRGYEYPLIKFVVITESDIFGQEKKKRKKQKRYEGRQISSFSELSIGDFVVHENHGLGIYKGIEKIEVDHVTKDYMKIEYAGGSNLYVPATQLDVIQKYADGDSKTPKLNKLGTQEWNRTKSKVRTAVREIAQDLVKLYAERQRKDGFTYSEDTVWQREFEEMFPFEETEDQLTAIEEVKRDMQSTKIMDRLICGDVGYGKTEIAIRAAFKAVQDGKQVAYLVPTTILAQQHYNTFLQRMKDFPVRVDLLCRFRTPAEQKKTLTDLKKGLVDIVIGTHRLLSKDVQYKDLGLLVIDEEQRFGVTHKEKIKQLKTDIDVMTLTATPIPRTLHMSLVGIRDMSVLEEAPLERVPIQTYVMEYNEELVREAISRELSRGGQVYYVYNRVNTIVEFTNRVAALVPQARVAFAHGQMKEHELERIMVDFINGDIDVLVTTTIIETGLDISNVNTMIIHDADTMGLAQLYQLRGRVGRSNRTAYAFLMYRRDKMLREVAEKRLSAIREFTELGSGIRIAMRDLEIRGAGNLLGSEQSGHMAAVGYDLYCKLLNESVKEAQGVMPPQDSFETTIDLDIDAFIPERYIRSETQKLDVYKRIAAIRTEEEHEDMLEELIDRFGEPPRPVQNLLTVARLRAQAHEAWIAELAQKGNEIRIQMYERAQIDVSRIDSLLKDYRGRLKFVFSPAQASPGSAAASAFRTQSPAGSDQGKDGAMTKSGQAATAVQLQKGKPSAGDAGNGTSGQSGRTAKKTAAPQFIYTRSCVNGKDDKETIPLAKELVEAIGHLALPARESGRDEK